MLGALAGFSLVFVVTAVTLSAIAALLLETCAGALRARGPMAERRAAEAAAALPVVVAVIAVGALTWQSLMGSDHCAVHGHHAHLCFTHGTMWIERGWVVVVLAMSAATFAARAILLAVSYVRGAASIRTLRALARSGDAGGPGDDVRIVDSERAFCFVSRGGVFVSSRVWQALPEAERSALVAHERAHELHGDLPKRLAIEVLLLFAAPLVGDRIRAAWMHASERLCDAHAARQTAPETVASAMVSMCRLGCVQPASSFAFTPSTRDLASRVESVLAQRPLGEDAARVLGRIALSASVTLAVLGMIAAEPIHHAFETLLG